MQRVFGTRVKLNALVIFTRQFATMIGAGVPLLRALNSLKEHTENKLLRDTLGTVAQDIQGGLNLADAMAKHPNVFNDIYVNMVRAGEAAGKGHAGFRVNLCLVDTGNFILDRVFHGRDING